MAKYKERFVKGHRYGLCACSAEELFYQILQHIRASGRVISIYWMRETILDAAGKCKVDVVKCILLAL